MSILRRRGHATKANCISIVLSRSHDSSQRCADIRTIAQRVSDPWKKRAPENKGSKNLPPHEDQSIGSSQSGGSESTTQTSPSSESRSRASRDSSSGQEARSASQGIGQQDVRQAQEALKNQGHDPGPVDGIMGSQTRQALRAFQSKNGLKQTGMLDAETKIKLNIVHSGVDSDQTSRDQYHPGSASGFAPKDSGPMRKERSSKQKESSSR